MKKRYLRRQNLFDPHSSKPYKLSRTKVELFLECSRCFYLDRVKGLRRPGRVTYSLNNAVDLLLKREFDHYRMSGTKHPIMNQNGIDAVPYHHDEIDRWREALHGGLQYVDPATNLLLTGAPDDLWVDSTGGIHVVDYKATRHLTQESLDEGSQDFYQRQLEFYSWLLVKMGFSVSTQGFFVVAESRIHRHALDHALEFDLNLVRHKCDWSWVEPLLPQIKDCLIGDLPSPSSECEYCNYIDAHDDLLTTPVQGTLL